MPSASNQLASSAFVAELTAQARAAVLPSARIPSMPLPPLGRPLRVLSIAHTATSRAIGRLRYHPFAGRDEVEVHLVAPARWQEFGRSMVADPPDDPGVTVHILPIRLPSLGRVKWYLHHYRGLDRVIAHVKPDVIHLWEEPWSAVALQACRLRRKLAPQAALVLEVDQNILKQLPPPFQQIRRHVLSETDHLLSRTTDATIVARASGYSGPATLIGYGVDQVAFRPQDREAARAEFGLSGFTVGYVGRIVEEKGLDDALDALALLPDSAEPVSLAILGEGPHAPALRRRVAELGLTERVHWFGWDSPARVGTFINALDALLLLTRTTGDVKEQFGRVIIEAQACGVPVIGSSCGAIPQIVGEGGWVVPEHDPVALSALLDLLSSEPERCAAPAAAGLRQITERFTYAQVANTLLHAWDESHAARRTSAA
jgi:glycosyltransferase involved in cell wall biosynthesis